MLPASIALPDRSLACRPPGAGLASVAWRWLLVLALLVPGAALLIPPVGDLVRDFGLAGAAVPVPGARAEGRCSTHQAIFTDCDVTLTAPGPHRRVVHYMFVDFHAGDYRVDVLADPARPDVLTTDLALAKRWNRALTFALAAALFGLAVLALFRFTASEVRWQRATLRALSNQRLRLVLLPMADYGLGGWVVRTDAGVRRWRMPRRARPIVMDPVRRLILAVTAGDGRFTLPLDRDLRWINLNDGERRAVLAAVPPDGLGAWLTALDSPAMAAVRRGWRRAARVIGGVGLAFSLATGASAGWAFSASGTQEAIAVFALCFAFAAGALLGAGLLRAKVARHEAILR